MTNDIWHIVIYFLFYAMLGWVWETIYCSYRERKFVYRGFLSGPYCPIYGFGVLLVLTLLTPLFATPAVLFVVALVAMTTLEYLSSYILEKIFRQRWWDYSGEPLNFQGRIAMLPSLFWATMSVVIVTLIQPHVVQLANTILAVGVWIPLVVLGVVVADAAHTIVRLAGMTKLIKQIQLTIGEQTDQLGDIVDERVRELRRSGRPLVTEARLLKAFPRLNDQRFEHYADIRKELLRLRALRRKQPTTKA